jgi:hypothetical protein
VVAGVRVGPDAVLEQRGRGDKLEQGGGGRRCVEHVVPGLGLGAGVADVREQLPRLRLHRHDACIRHLVPAQQLAQEAVEARLERKHCLPLALERHDEALLHQLAPVEIQTLQQLFARGALWCYRRGYGLHGGRRIGRARRAGQQTRSQCEQAPNQGKA